MFDDFKNVKIRCLKIKLQTFVRLLALINLNGLSISTVHIEVSLKKNIVNGPKGHENISLSFKLFIYYKLKLNSSQL